jgi:hypothetical protein
VVATQIRALDPECRNVLSNMWLANTNLPMHYIRARLLPHLSSKDKLYICNVDGEAIGVNLDHGLTVEPHEAAARRSGFFVSGLLRSVLRRRSKLLMAATATTSAPRSIVRVAIVENSRSA